MNTTKHNEMTLEEEKLLARVANALEAIARQKMGICSNGQEYSGLTDLEKAVHRGFLCAGLENVSVGIIKETAQDCLLQMQKDYSWLISVSSNIEPKADIVHTTDSAPIDDGKAMLHVADKSYKIGWRDCKYEMMKDAVDGVVIKTDKHTSVRYNSCYGTDRYFYGIADKQFKAGDKVKIIIVKENKK